MYPRTIIDSLPAVPNRDQLTHKDLHAHFSTGQSILLSGSGRDKKYGYRNGIQTDLGDIRNDVWRDLVRELIVRSHEEDLFDKLLEREKEHTYWLKTKAELEHYTLELYAARIFDNPKWVDYYNVDEIHNGISSNRKIRFLYFEYNVAKERVYRHDGAYYVVSPFAMTWDDENYYMVAFDSAAGIIKHYRVDKMEKITVLDEERDGQDAYEALDMAVYARKTFGMFTGEEVKVHLRFENHLVGAVLDRLGRDVILVPDGEDHFTVWTDVIVSPQFFAWLCRFQTAAKVIGPDDVVKQMAEHVKSIAEQYE